MKRKALGIRMPPAKRQSRTVDGYDKESPTQSRSRDLIRKENIIFTENSGASLDKTPVNTNRARLTQKLQEIDNRKTQLFEQDAYDFRDLLEATTSGNERSGDNKKKRERESDSSRSFGSSKEDHANPIDDSKSIKRLRFNDSLTNDKEAVAMPNLVFDTSVELPNNQHPAVQDQMIMNKYDDEESQGLPMRPATSVAMARFATWSKFTNPDEIDLSSSEVGSANEMDVDEISRKPAKIYSDLVQNLIQHFPEMGEKVNEVKRSTALDMWKEDAQRTELITM